MLCFIELRQALISYQDYHTLLLSLAGLPRRFATRLHLVDYSAAELALIAEKAARERFELN